MDGALLAGLVGGGIVVVGNALVWIFGFGKAVAKVETQCTAFAQSMNGKGGIRDDIAEVKKEVMISRERTDGISRHLGELEGIVQTYITLKEGNSGKRRKSNP